MQIESSLPEREFSSDREQRGETNTVREQKYFFGRIEQLESVARCAHGKQISVIPVILM